MKYKVGDRVRIKSLDWYDKNKNEFGNVPLGQFSFNCCNTHLCGTILTISRVLSDYYLIEENDAYWTDDMIEGLVGENPNANMPREDFNIIQARQISNTAYNGNELYDKGIACGKIFVLPEEMRDERLTIERFDGYQFIDENGNVINAQKIVLEKKKKKYPKTYEECAEIIAELTGSDCNPKGCMGYMSAQLTALQKLLICRDAYWKLYGEEMGLDGHWEPDWTGHELKYCIKVIGNTLKCVSEMNIQCILAFPTEELRDAFKENFDPDIEICKELL